MQKSKEKQKQSVDTEESSSTLQDSESDERSIKKRYIDLWRIRLKNNKLRDSLIPSGTAAFLLSAFSFATSQSILSASIFFLIGTILGLVYSGYKYQTDNFTGFHIALLSYVPLALTLLIATSVTAPGILPFVIPLVLFYAVAVGSSGVTYSMLGREASEE